MSASALLEELRAAGLTVRVDRGWETRGNDWARRKPIGVMQHHTSLPVPYPIEALNGSRDGRIKCNMNTKPDGTVWLIAYDACNYASGGGTSIVWEETLRAIAPRANARQRGLQDDMYGNRYYWNIENDHAGTGGPLPVIQFDALVIATQVVNDHFGFAIEQVVSHAEWTARKSDPYWDGSMRAIETIRQTLEENMFTKEELAQAVWDHVEEQYGDFRGKPDQRAGTLLAQAHANAWEAVEQAGVLKALFRSDVSDADLEAAVDELAALINKQPDEFIAKLKAKL